MGILMSDTSYYVYGHYTADTDQLFYIGKGHHQRAWSTEGRNPHWQRIVEAKGYTVKFFQEHLTEDEAYRLEADLIRTHGIHKLANVTNPDDWYVVHRRIEAPLTEQQSLPRYAKKFAKDALAETKYNHQNKERQLERLFPDLKPTPIVRRRPRSDNPL